MLSAILLSVVIGLATAAPKPAPQNIDTSLLNGIVIPVEGPALGAVKEDVSYDAAAAAEAAADGITSDASKKRNLIETLTMTKRNANDPCGVQPNGYGPKTANPDTDQYFISNTDYSFPATNVNTPPGYERSFVNMHGSTQQNGYLGLRTLQSYSARECAQLCDAELACVAFNLYFERDPSLNPAPACPNPPSITNIKCTLWGYPVSAATATNQGQWRGPQDSHGQAFHVVIAGSNGYTKNPPPPSQPGYNGPQRLGGAINAPLYNGVDTFVGSRIYTDGPYDPGQCAAACTATTDYDRATAGADGKYKPCNCFNAYVLSRDDVPQGTYCAFYTRPWAPSYATNTGQYRGQEYWGVSQSYSFTLSPQDPGVVS